MAATESGRPVLGVGLFGVWRGGADTARRLTDEIARGVREAAPAGWRRLEASFAMTVVCESAVLVVDDGTRSVRHKAPSGVWGAVRRHRALSARSGTGPWWRLLVRVDETGAEVMCDFGAEPFPGEQLFEPNAYLADLESFPRERLPVWLAAYVGLGEPLSRPPRLAAARARADRGAGVRAMPMDGELPDLRELWARWAVLSAAFVAVASNWGPRVCPSVGVFESAGRSGSTLALLPGGRAVLSGGVWNAPVLDAAYNEGAAVPKFFAGAPYWVTDQVLNARVSTGSLSFCYWWEAGRWYRGESAPVSECTPALPAVWTVHIMAEIVADLTRGVSGAAPAATESLVFAAQTGGVTRETIRNVLGDSREIDLDAAFFQFVIADLAVAGSDSRATPVACGNSTKGSS